MGRLELGKSIQAGRVAVRGFDKKGRPIGFELYGLGVGSSERLRFSRRLGGD